MSIGTVTIDDAGAATGSGDALLLFNAIQTLAVLANPLPDPATPDHDWEGTAIEWRAEMLPIVVRIKRGWAREAQAHANIFSAKLGKFSVRGVVATGPITADDEVLAVGTRGAAITLTAPAGLDIGKQLLVADDAALASTWNIVVAITGETINSSGSTRSILTDSGYLRIVKTSATNWIEV